MTGPSKHATASVFLFDRLPRGHEGDRSARTGLIYHPRLNRWMIPGGHVEVDENPAEAAVREVREETGCTASLVATGIVACPAMTDERPVPPPLWIVEQDVPAERREAAAHVHVDHLYVAVVDAAEVIGQRELTFRWFDKDELEDLGMFQGTLACLRVLYQRQWTTMA